MNYFFFPAFIISSLACFLLGLLLILKPEMAIEVQRRFYAMINWKIEPISMSKEISNTRAFGVILIILWIISLAYTIFFYLRPTKPL